MRVTVKTNVTITNDTDGKESLFGLDDGGSLAKEIADNYQRCVSGRFNIAAAGTENLPLGDIDAVRGIMVVSDADFNYVMNGGGDTIVCARAGTATTSKCRVLLQATVTQFAITNPSGTAALNGIWVAWGDLTA